MKKSPYKVLTAVLLIYVFIMGLVGEVPRLPRLYETIRNLYFHVPLWFGMIGLLAGSVYHSVRYLRNSKIEHDQRAVSLAEVAVVFGILGYATGMLWGPYAWDGGPMDWIFQDPKTLGAMIGLLIYAAYFVLRASMDDEIKSARVSSVYSIFAYTLLIFFVFVFPRISGVDSVHPGSGGNPGFNTYDLDSNMRMVFYPAVIAYLGLGTWISELRFRIRRLQDQAAEF
jgi:heme exporter protein C